MLWVCDRLWSFKMCYTNTTNYYYWVGLSKYNELFFIELENALRPATLCYTNTMNYYCWVGERSEARHAGLYKYNDLLLLSWTIQIQWIIFIGSPYHGTWDICVFFVDDEPSSSVLWSPHWRSPHWRGPHWRALHWKSPHWKSPHWRALQWRWSLYWKSLQCRWSLGGVVGDW